MKMRLRGLFFSSILVFIACGTFPPGSAQVADRPIQVTGRIYVMGNEPFTRVAIQADDGRVFALAGEHARELRALQGKRMLVEGQLRAEEVRGAKEIEVGSYKIIDDGKDKKRGGREN